MKQAEKLIPLNTVVEMTSLSGTTIWRMERDNNFPKRRKIAASRVAWVQSEVEDWINSKLQAA